MKEVDNIDRRKAYFLVSPCTVTSFDTCVDKRTLPRPSIKHDKHQALHDHDPFSHRSLFFFLLVRMPCEADISLRLSVGLTLICCVLPLLCARLLTARRMYVLSLAERANKGRFASRVPSNVVTAASLVRLNVSSKWVSLAAATASAEPDRTAPAREGQTVSTTRSRILVTSRSGPFRSMRLVLVRRFCDAPRQEPFQLRDVLLPLVLHLGKCKYNTEQTTTTNGYGKVCTTTSTPTTSVRPLWTTT